MTYGTVKAKSLIYESGGSDVTFDYTNLIQNGDNFSGGIIQGQLLSGVTGVFTDLISGNTIQATTFTAPVLSGVSGVFTSVISGASYKASGNVTVITGSGDIRPYGTLSFPPYVGASGQFLTSNGDGSTNWETDVYAVEIVSGTVTGEAGKTYVIISGTTLTLPATPATGAFLSVVNKSNTTTGTVARNGESIMGAAEDLTIDDVNFAVDFIYYGGSEGWVFI